MDFTIDFVIPQGRFAGYSLLTDIPRAILCTFNHEVAAQFLMRHSVFDPQTGCVFSD